MLVLLSRIVAGMQHGLKLAERERTRRQLLNRSDRFLEDIGISRELLEAGVHTWPWRQDPDGVRAEAAV